MTLTMRPSLSVAAVDDTVFAGASKPAPLAGATIVSIAAASLVSGARYSCTLSYMLSGTAETLLDNGKLLINNIAVVTGLPTITGAANVSVSFTFVANGINALTFVTISAATAGSVYSAVLTATRVA